MENFKIEIYKTNSGWTTNPINNFTEKESIEKNLGYRYNGIVGYVVYEFKTLNKLLLHLNISKKDLQRVNDTYITTL
tara:strand:+ start:266 stop:496 length:231 start_codon:yes stop_codon:yes gene_type:complete